MTTTTLERTEGLSVLNQAMAAIKEKIEEKRGVFNIQMEVIKKTKTFAYLFISINWCFVCANDDKEQQKQIGNAVTGQLWLGHNH